MTGKTLLGLKGCWKWRCYILCELNLSEKIKKYSKNVKHKLIKKNVIK